MNLVLQTLDAAGEPYDVHTHPPIRGEADLHLNGVCADAAVTLLLDATVPAMGTVYCGGGDPETTIDLDAAALARIAAHPIVAPIIG